jgi:hypothetical protein
VSFDDDEMILVKWRCYVSDGTTQWYLCLKTQKDHKHLQILVMIDFHKKLQAMGRFAKNTHFVPITL